MAGCGKQIEVCVPSGWSYKMIPYKCGHTLPSGYPALCDDCEEINAGRDWRREAEDAGEQWDPEPGVGPEPEGGW